MPSPGSGDTIWVATNNGIFCFNTRTGDGRDISRLTKGFRITRSGIYLSTDNDNVWIATRSNGLIINFQQEELMDRGKCRAGIYFHDRRQDGNLWAGTYGDGVFQFSARHPELLFFRGRTPVKFLLQYRHRCQWVILDRSQAGDEPDQCENRQYQGLQCGGRYLSRLQL